MGWAVVVLPAAMLAWWAGLRVFRGYQDFRIRQHRRASAWMAYREWRQSRGR